MVNKQQLTELLVLERKFIIGERQFSPKQRRLFMQIEELKKEEQILVNRLARIRNLIKVMYKKGLVSKERK